MSQSTNGQIAFGIVYDEGTEFPWSERDDFDDWWLNDICNFKPSREIWDEAGNFINGVRPEQSVINAYFNEKDEFLENHVCLIEPLNVCSYEYPIYALIISSTKITASGGNPTVFEPDTLVVTDEEIQALKDFCETFNIPYSEPSWFLSSLWC